MSKPQQFALVAMGLLGLGAAALWIARGEAIILALSSLVCL
jgi:hypothetical protein